MGPGPTNAHPRVLSAQSLPLLGHLHPPFLAIMDEIQQGLRYLFQTSSPYVLLVMPCHLLDHVKPCMSAAFVAAISSRVRVSLSGDGHAGMEATIANCLEPGLCC